MSVHQETWDNHKQDQYVYAVGTASLKIVCCFLP